jgi:hypothetical protein
MAVLVKRCICTVYTTVSVMMPPFSGYKNETTAWIQMPLSTIATNRGSAVLTELSTRAGFGAVSGLGSFWALEM